jgi:hypothetical protein
VIPFPNFANSVFERGGTGSSMVVLTTRVAGHRVRGPVAVEPRRRCVVAIHPISAGISVLPSPPARGRSLPHHGRPLAGHAPGPDPRAWPHPSRAGSRAMTRCTPCWSNAPINSPAPSRRSVVIGSSATMWALSLCNLQVRVLHGGHSSSWAKLCTSMPVGSCPHSRRKTALLDRSPVSCVLGWRKALTTGAIRAKRAPSP